MESRAKLLGHSIHQQLIVLPLGLLAAAVIFDVAHWIYGTEALAVTAFWMTVGGIVGGLAAAPFGWIDWFAIPYGTRAKTIGIVHGLTNTTVVLLFIVSADEPQLSQLFELLP